MVWMATVVANVGTWMYNAASGWLMTSLNPDPLTVSLVQVASSSPMFLFALPAGALADTVDKRRFLIGSEIVITVIAAISAMAQPLARGFDRAALQTAMRAGAARNALDCAFWDLSAKQRGIPVHEIAGLPPPRPLTTSYTISLAAPDVMAAAAAKAAERALLKVKLGAGGDAERIAAVRRAAPLARRSVLTSRAFAACVRGSCEARPSSSRAAGVIAGKTLLVRLLPIAHQCGDRRGSPGPAHLAVGSSRYGVFSR